MNSTGYDDGMRERCSIGVDVGHTNIRVARVEGGVPVEVRRERTDAPGGSDGVLEQVSRMVLEVDGDRSPVGVGIAGQCDKAQGVVRCGPNFFWPDVPFQALLSSRVQAPVVLRNDVVMATVGEWKHGAGKGVEEMACPAGPTAPPGRSSPSTSWRRSTTRAWRQSGRATSSRREAMAE